MPFVIGGRTLRILTILLIVDALLFAATVILLAVLGIAPVSHPVLAVLGIAAVSHPVLVYWETGLGIAFVLLAVMLAIGPALAFLIHIDRDERVTQRLRYSATASAVAPGLLGVPLILLDSSAQLVGWILICVAAAVIVRAWTARRADASADGAVVGYKYSLAGIVALVVVAPVTVVAIGRSHNYGFRIYTKSDAYVVAMKSDLRVLISAQESYFADHKRYSTDLAELVFKPSTGVGEPKVTVGQGWWHATNTHSQLSNFTCGIAVNATNPVVATARAGEPACK